MAGAEGTVSNWRRRRTSAEPMVEIIHDGYALFHRVQALAQRGITLTIVDTAGGWSDACTGGHGRSRLVPYSDPPKSGRH
jgi:chromosome partitioning protein